MLLKLPIIINGKIDIINFKLTKHENKIIIDPLIKKENDLYQILITNKEFCMNKFNIKFPYEIKIIENKYLFSKYFFITAISNGFDCDLNFLTRLLKIINNDSKDPKEDFSFLSLEYLSLNIKDIIKKSNIQMETRNNFENFNDMELYIDNQLNYSINLIYLLLYKFPEYNTKEFKNNSLYDIIPKKILICLNLIKNYQLKFKGSDSISIGQHIDNIINTKLITTSVKKNNYYFFKLNENRIIKMKVELVSNELITLNDSRIIDAKICKIYTYNPVFLEHLNYSYFMKDLMKYNHELKLLISYKLFKKNNLDIRNIINFIYIDNTNNIGLSSLRNLGFIFNELNFEEYNIKDINLEITIIKDGSISKEYINYLSNKYKNDLETKLNILKTLFNKYNFPLTFNKKKLNDNFEIIMYFSFLNYKDIIKIIDNEKIYLENSIIDMIPLKLKNLYFNLIKTYYQFKNESLENITYNFKYYQDYIYIYVIKNIIQNNSILTELFDNKSLYNKMVNVYKNNFILSQLIKNLTWGNLSSKLNYLNYIYNNTNLIFYQNKLNKNLFNDNIDYKIKGIILDKFLMYKYLKQEKDFIKWTKFIKNFVGELYEKKISISNDDLSLLGKLIYKLYNITNQNLKDDRYSDLINFSQKNRKLIISDNRINLMIRDKFSSINCQLNLGFFAKHLNFSTTDKIELSNDVEFEEINVKLKKVTKKYYKYKGKYLKTKTTTTSISNFN
jgi:hypothetical protein